MAHQVVAFLISLAVGYWLLTLAEKQTALRRPLARCSPGSLLWVPSWVLFVSRLPLGAAIPMVEEAVIQCGITGTGKVGKDKGCGPLE